VTACRDFIVTHDRPESPTSAVSALLRVGNLAGSASPGPSELGLNARSAAGASARPWRLCQRRHCQSRLVAVRQLSAMTLGASLKVLLPNVPHATRISARVTLPGFQVGATRYDFRPGLLSGRL